MIINKADQIRNPASQTFVKTLKIFAFNFLFSRLKLSPEAMAANVGAVT